MRKSLGASQLFGTRILSDSFHVLRLTFESAGIELQIDPFAVVQNITQQQKEPLPYLSEATDNIAANPETDEFTEATPENRLYNEGMEVV